MASSCDPSNRKPRRDFDCDITMNELTPVRTQTDKESQLSIQWNVIITTKVILIMRWFKFCNLCSFEHPVYTCASQWAVSGGGSRKVQAMPRDLAYSHKVSTSNEKDFKKLSNLAVWGKSFWPWWAVTIAMNLKMVWNSTHMSITTVSSSVSTCLYMHICASIRACMHIHTCMHMCNECLHVTMKECINGAHAPPSLHVQI